MAWLQTRFLDPRGQESHEVFVMDQITIFVDNSYCYDVIVGIDLVHEGSHDDKSLFWLDDLLLALFLLTRLWLTHFVVLVQ